MKWLFGGIATLTILVASTVMILTSSCGENYCGFGVIGDCEKMYKDAQQQAGSCSGVGGGGDLSITPVAGQDPVDKGRQANVCATGGVSPVQQLTPTDPEGCGTIDTTKWIFTPGTIGGLCKIRFRDGANPVHETTFQITVRLPQ